jgi:hypothetical protein
MGTQVIQEPQVTHTTLAALIATRATVTAWWQLPPPSDPAAKAHWVPCMLGTSGLQEGVGMEGYLGQMVDLDRTQVGKDQMALIRGADGLLGWPRAPGARAWLG